MASGQTTKTRRVQREAINSGSEAPWVDLELTVPNDRTHVSIVGLVECALVELTHEPVGAVFVSRQVGRTKRTQYIADDDVGEWFTKRRFDDRLGWHETTVSRRTVRDELVNRLSRSVSERTDGMSDADTETFRVRPVHQLETSHKLTNTEP
jgi:hypothetical protein